MKKNTIAGLTIAALAALTLIGAPSAAHATDTDKTEKVAICHAKGPNAKNGWTNNIVAKEAVFSQGHDGHDADIIQAFDYKTQRGEVKRYPGKNLDTTYTTDFGRVVTGSWLTQNGCALPAQPAQPAPDEREREDEEIIDCFNFLVTHNVYTDRREYVWDAAGQAWVPGEWVNVEARTSQRPATATECPEGELPETGGETATVIGAGIIGAGALAGGVVLMRRRKEA